MTSARSDRARSRPRARLLAAYDTAAQGGNGDGVIGAADAVFGRLRLWVDANHDGVSQPEELVPLAVAGRGGDCSLGCRDECASARIPQRRSGLTSVRSDAAPLDARKPGHGAPRQVVARHDFLPFGEEVNPQIPPRDRKLFTGQERDVETGLDDFHARQLRVDLGRFTTPDPIADMAWSTGMVGVAGAYGYGLSNPLRFSDPTGAEASSGDGRSNDDLVHPAHIIIDGFILTWDPARGYYVCGGCDETTAAIIEGRPTFRTGITIHAPSSDPLAPLRPTQVTQTLTPMGAGALSFFAGRGTTAGVGVGGAGQGAGPANPQPTQPPKPQHPNCGPLANNLQGTGFGGLDTAVDAAIRVERPFQAAVAVGAAALATAGQLFVAGLLVGAGCLNPTPAEPATCVVSAIAAGHMLIGAAATGYGIYLAARHVMLPAVKELGCR